MTPATLTFYSISQFGYFKRGNDNPLFGDLPTILSELSSWATNLNSLAATRVNGIDRRGCYLVEAERIGQTENFLVVLWNESHNEDGRVPSIFLDSEKGNPKIAENDIEEGSIPGFPTYFLFLPSRRKIVTIRFQGDSSCLQNISLYLQGFMRFFSKHVVGEKVDGVFTIHGFRADPSDTEEPPCRAAPRLRLRLVPKPSAAAEIMVNHPKIRAVIREEFLNTRLPVEQSKLSKLLDFLHPGRAGAPIVSESLKTVVEVDYKPSAEELQALIDDFSSSDDANNCDLGFKMSGESGTRWLGRGSLQEKMDFDIVRLNGVVQLNGLVQALNRVMPTVLALADG